MRYVLILMQLDLSLSLPYWLAYVRAEATRYAEDLDRRMHTLLDEQSTDGRALRAPLAMVAHQLDAAYHAVGHMSQRLPTSTALFESIPSRNDLHGKMRTLIHDWEHRARTFHPTLFTPSVPLSLRSVELEGVADGKVALVDELPAWTYASPLDMIQGEWTSGVYVPSTSEVSEEVHRRLNHFFEQMYNIPMHLSAGALPARIVALEQPASDLLHRFEETLDSVSKRGRAGATEFVHRASRAVHDMEDAVYQAACELAREGRVLISYDNLPMLWRNNDCIHTGYRFIPVRNWTTLLRSIFQIHNETGNIHTHLGGLVLVAGLYYFAGALDSLTTPMDRWIQTLYLIAAAKCLACSVSWHVMAGCADLQWFQCFACIDYTGISWLVAASLLTLVYNGFYCQPHLIALYSVGVFALGATMGILPWAPWFDDPKNRSLRISLFIFMALVGLVPFSHGAYLHGFWRMYAFYAPVLPSLASYVAGVAVYAMRFPEKYWPGRFDLVGHSHQMWHIAIVVAIALHFRAILLFHENRFAYSHVSGSCPSMQWPSLNVAAAWPWLSLQASSTWPWLVENLGAVRGALSQHLPDL